jgi:hypothetical protein
MHVEAAGPGSPNLDLRVQQNSFAGPSTDSSACSASLSNVADGISTSLQHLTSTQLLKLLDDIERPRLSQDHALIDSLVQTAVVYGEQGDVARALHALSQAVTLNPERGQELVNAQVFLAPIRLEAANLLERLSFEAKSRAEQILAAASVAIGSSSQMGVRAHNPDAQILMALAGRLIESGQHINFVRAGELGQAILAYYGAPVMDATPNGLSNTRTSNGGKALTIERTAHWLRTSWRRVPLLVLLVAWLFLGIVGGLVALITLHPSSALPSEIWALGFIGLVGFQFFVRVRNTRF